MPSYFFKSALLGRDWAENVRLHVKGGRISMIETGASPELAETVYGPVLPAMANVHSHAFQRMVAGLTEYYTMGTSDFWTWRTLMYQAARLMTPATLKDIAAGLYLEMLKAGYGSVAEFHYLHHSHLDHAAEMSDAIFAAAAETGISLLHMPVLYEASDFGGAAPTDGQRPFLHSATEFAGFLHHVAGKQTAEAKVGLAFHSLRAVKPDSFEPTIAVMDALSPGAPVHIHVAEQLREVEASLKYSGKRPVEWMLDHLPIDARWCLIHATHVTEAEWKGMIDRGAIAGLCPTTEANLGDGLFPAFDYLNAGGRFAIGSDSHVSVDPREELRLLEYGQRLFRRERTVLAPRTGGHTGERLWARAAAGGAAALGINGGEIEVGKRADLIVLDGDAPALAGPRYGQVADAFVFRGAPIGITHVMRAGDWLISEGRHKREDEIMGRFRATLERLAALLELED